MQDSQLRARGRQFGVPAQVLFAGCCLGVLAFGVLFEVLATVRAHFCEIYGRVLWGCCLGRSWGDAVGGAGVQSLARFSLFGVYAGVISICYTISWCLGCLFIIRLLACLLSLVAIPAQLIA